LISDTANGRTRNARVYFGGVAQGRRSHAQIE
jgi:hypothetical protein